MSLASLLFLTFLSPATPHTCHQHMQYQRVRGEDTAQQSRQWLEMDLEHRRAPTSAVASVAPATVTLSNTTASTPSCQQEVGHSSWGHNERLAGDSSEEKSELGTYDGASTRDASDMAPSATQCDPQQHGLTTCLPLAISRPARILATFLPAGGWPHGSGTREEDGRRYDHEHGTPCGF